MLSGLRFKARHRSHRGPCEFLSQPRGLLTHPKTEASARRVPVCGKQSMLGPQARHDLESPTSILKCRHPVSPRINPRNPYTDGSLKQLQAAKAWPPTEENVEQSWPRYALDG